MSGPWLSYSERVDRTAIRVDRLCEVMHDAYERAAEDSGWQTQEASRKPWADVPEANKRAMRAAVIALLEVLTERVEEAS